MFYCINSLLLKRQLNGEFMGTVNWRCTLDVISLFALIFSAQ